MTDSPGNLVFAAEPTRHDALLEKAPPDLRVLSLIHCCNARGPLRGVALSDHGC